MKKLFLIFALTIILVPFPAAADEELDLVIDRVIQAYGGAKVDTIRSYRMEGIISARRRKIEGSMKRTFRRSQSLKVEIDYPANPEVRILDGDRGWRTDPKEGTIREVEGALYKSMVLQAARANIPWILVENWSDIREIPGRIIDNRMTMGLELTIGQGMLMRFYINPTTHLVIHSQAILNTPQLKTYFETAYSNFRKVRGVMFPFREKNFASGFQTGTTVINKININPADVNRGTFRPTR